MSSNNEKIAIAIPKVLYSNLSNVVPIGKNFWRSNGNNFRSIIEQYINFNNQYYPAELTIAYTMYIKYNCQEYFEKMMQIWKERDVFIIHGKGCFAKIKNNIFNNAKSVEYFALKDNKNAFNEYPQILNSFIAKKVNKEKLIIAILGPTDTVLCYDLTLLGYQALDLGHIVKSYDYFIENKKTTTMNELVEFFND